MKGQLRDQENFYLQKMQMYEGEIQQMQEARLLDEKDISDLNN